MPFLLSMAWRNTLRNSRRTALTGTPGAHTRRASVLSVISSSCGPVAAETITMFAGPHSRASSTNRR